MKLPSRPLFRHPKTPIRPAPVHFTLQAVCDPRIERMVRALCVVMFADTDVRIKSLDSVESDGSADVTVHIVLTSDAATAVLERLVVRLARIPKVSALRWHPHTENAPAPEPPATPSDKETRSDEEPPSDKEVTSPPAVNARS